MSDLKYDTLSEKIAYWLLRPGDYVCDVFDVRDVSNRYLLRMFLNLSVYAVVFGTLAFFFAV